MTRRHLACCLFCFASAALPAPPNSPAELVRAAIQAMGGEPALRALRAVRVEGIGYTNMLEQSERPEGPWLQNYQQTTEVRDLAGGRIWRSNANRSFQAEQWPRPTEGITIPGFAALHAADRWIPGSRSDLQSAEQTLAFAPERLLLTALEAKDLHAEPDTMLQDVPHRVVAFSWRGHRARVLLNAHTRLPTAVDFTCAYPDFFWNVWGDVTSRTLLSLWDLQKGGILYPRQWDVSRNGQPYRTFAVTKVEWNVAISEEQLAIPEETRKAFAGRPQTSPDDVPLAEGKEIAPGVIQFEGAWNTTIVRQASGIVILEAVISSGHAAKVLAEAGRRFPRVPIQAAVSTSDSWPHFSGVREYVARGIPVDILDVNRSILDRAVKAPHTQIPDALERAPRAPRWRIVSGKTVVGQGPNRMELYPVRGEGGERMMLAWFPEQHLLYGSDLVQHRGATKDFFWPEYLLEVNAVVEREKLEPRTVFAMHLPPTPWDDVVAAIRKAKEP